MSPGWHALGYPTTSVERASGQHAKDLLVIIEEASGVEDEIWNALYSLKYSKLVAIGNPIRAEGALSILSVKRTKIEKIAFHQIRQSMLFAFPQLNRPTLI